MGAVGSTSDNLRSAISGETSEFMEMYPRFIEQAKKEKASDAVILSFDVANNVEKIHASLYKKALDNLGRNEEVDYYRMLHLRQYRREQRTREMSNLQRSKGDVQEDRLR